MTPEGYLRDFRPFLDAPISGDPFTHTYAEGVFGDELYGEILKNLPGKGEWKPHGAAHRDFLPLTNDGFQRLSKERAAFWKALCSWLCSRDTMQVFLDKFGITQTCRVVPSLVRQKAGYSLGPHTDSPNKVLTVLFYLPQKDCMEAGTVIYRPKARGFKCAGTMHHAFRDFETVKVVPFKPDSVFAFVKSDISFHGVEPVKTTRDVLQYNINA